MKHKHPPSLSLSSSHTHLHTYRHTKRWETFPELQIKADGHRNLVITGAAKLLRRRKGSRAADVCQDTLGWFLNSFINPFMHHRHTNATVSRRLGYTPQASTHLLHKHNFVGSTVYFSFSLTTSVISGCGDFTPPCGQWCRTVLVNRVLGTTTKPGNCWRPWDSSFHLCLAFFPTPPSSSTGTRPNCSAGCGPQLQPGALSVNYRPASVWLRSQQVPLQLLWGGGGGGGRAETQSSPSLSAQHLLVVCVVLVCTTPCQPSQVLITLHNHNVQKKKNVFG